jgi:hypothetical protein
MIKTTIYTDLFPKNARPIDPAPSMALNFFAVENKILLTFTFVRKKTHTRTPSRTNEPNYSSNF